MTGYDRLRWRQQVAAAEVAADMERSAVGMIPEAMDNYFLASAGASAALVGLIFVAI